MKYLILLIFLILFGCGDKGAPTLTYYDMLKCRVGQKFVDQHHWGMFNSQKGDTITYKYDDFGSHLLVSFRNSDSIITEIKTISDGGIF